MRGPGTSASWLTRLVYCTALLAPVIGTLGQSSWVGLATGGGVLGAVGALPFQVVVAAVVYRAYLVLRYRESLRARQANLFGQLLRLLGLLLMYVSAAGTLALFFVKPITLYLFKSPGDAGIGYFVVGVIAALSAGVGWAGCGAYELSRVMGPRPLHELPKRPAHLVKQDRIVAIVSLAIMVGGPLVSKLVLGDPCYGPTVLRCGASVEGGVARPAVVPFGDPVKLETAIDEIVMVRPGNPPVEVKESVMLSLAKTGHPVAEAASVTVSISIDDNKALTVRVTDALGETARFVTRLPSDTRARKADGGRRQLVFNLPSRTQASAFYTAQDPLTKETFVIDELFSQVRQAILSPLEAAEESKRVVRKATMLSEADEPNVSSLGHQQPSASCRDVVTLKRGLENETSLRPSRGTPLARMTFHASKTPDAYALAKNNDRTGCNTDGVWAINHLPPDGDIEIRRYSADGQLISFVATRLQVERLEGFFVDADSLRIKSGRIVFTVDSIPKPSVRRRRVYEVTP